MWLGQILLAHLLHGEILVQNEATAAEQKPQPAISDWPLRECQRVDMIEDECVCQEKYQICQPLQSSAVVNGSVTLPCSFSHAPNWVESTAAQVHWRIGSFHSARFLFNCCTTQSYTDPSFQGRVSLARQEGQLSTASIRITSLRESDSGLYFCRVSVQNKAWQTTKGTNLTVTAAPLQKPASPGFLIGVWTGVVVLAAAVLLGMATFLLTWRKGHCHRRTQTSRSGNRGQEEDKPEFQELHCRGARNPALEQLASEPGSVHPWTPGEPGLVYATVRLSDTPDKQGGIQRGGGAAEETLYAAVRH